ncbi:hypothetical protein B6V72_08995 [Thioclava sp. F34-6]|uniref:NfeD family protein n=1 Tax=Thioclava sp. F34-6 TaxID=1973003 RepID=UPI000B53C09E|nr:hypothetical protein [Thioclava sp. F34-6]OWY12936.1 hypothetical protein B6V72_08995 [Thioclava sp. F34-6]
MMDLWQLPWVWVVAGLVLGVAEMLIPGFIFLGFSIGAVVTGALVWIGIVGNSVPITLITFAILSIIAWLVLRKLMGVRRGQVKHWHDDINEN